MKEILPDYHGSPAPARDSGVLKLFAAATSILGDLLAADLPTILDGIFEPTLSMITQNMLDYPEHRLAFFNFLRIANEHCFEALFNIPPHLQKLVVDSIVWAFKHTERNIGEMGLEILYDLLQNLGRAPQVSQGFYQMFLLPLVQDIIYIMTDRLHKSGFRLQSMILMQIIHSVQLGAVTVPLFDLSAMPPGTDNVMFMKEYLSNLLSSSFPNVTKSSVHAFITGLFDVSLNIESFKQVVRDFLISCKEFAAEDNSELYTEEIEAEKESLAREQHMYRQSVPGLLPQSELDIDPDL
jgi:exportin-1